MKTLHNLQNLWFLLILLIVSYSRMVRSVEVTIPHSVVIGRAGSSVQLPCHYNTDVTSNFNVEWRFAPIPITPVKGKQIFYYENGKIYKPGSQSERLSILQNPPTSGVATLQLSELQQTDAGVYSCEVNNPPDFYGTGSGFVNLTVLVPPSTPSCQLNGQSNTGNDVTLTCSSSGIPSPVYSWSLVGSPLHLPTGSLEDQRSGSLLLTNLSLASFGTYQCEASNELGKATCDLTVTVTGNAEAGVIAGAVMGVLLFLLLLGAIAVYMLFIRRKRKKNTQTQYPGYEISEDAPAPGIHVRDGPFESQALQHREEHQGSQITVNSRFNRVV